MGHGVPTLILDLFSGIGGLSLGFKAAGFEVVGVELSKGRAYAYSMNVGKAVNADVRQLNFEEFRGAVGVIAGPPCRPYSIATPKSARGQRHPEYGLDLEVLRAVRALKPRFVVVEEVPGWNPEPVTKGLRGLGYDVDYELVAFADYGVPTMRRRWIVIAVRGASASDVFRELHGMREAPPRPIDLIKDLPEGPDPGIDHSTYNINSCIKDLIPYIPPGKALRDVANVVPRDLLSSCVKDVRKKHSYWLYRVPIEGLVKVVPHPRRSMMLHPTYNRMITVRELARLYTYPDSFTFKGLTIDEAMRAIADSVPPKFSQKLANAIKALVE